MLLRPLMRPLLEPLLQSPIGRVRAGGGASVDADAAAWAAAVTGNGGTYSPTTLTAVDTFVKAAKASGYWSKLNRINLFCGDQLAAALVPLKVGGGTALDTNVNFVAGDYSEATGLTGNGTSKYLRTGLIPSASLALNDTHLAVYNRSSAGSCMFGVVNSFELFAPQTDGYVYSDQYDTGATRAASTAAVGTPYGFVVGTRTGASAHSIYRNGVSIGTNVTASAAVSLAAIEAYVFALDSGGAPLAYSPASLGCYSIGSGLSDADDTAYNTHLQAFMAALGRAV